MVHATGGVVQRDAGRLLGGGFLQVMLELSFQGQVEVSPGVRGGRASRGLGRASPLQAAGPQNSRVCVWKIIRCFVFSLRKRDSESSGWGRSGGRIHHLGCSRKESGLRSAGSRVRGRVKQRKNTTRLAFGKKRREEGRLEERETS